jgi:hypothetical protein
MNLKEILNGIIPSYEDLHPGRIYEDDSEDGGYLPIFCPFCLASLPPVGNGSYCPICGKNISGNSKEDKHLLDDDYDDDDDDNDSDDFKFFPDDEEEEDDWGW